VNLFRDQIEHVDTELLIENTIKPFVYLKPNEMRMVNSIKERLKMGDNLSLYDLAERKETFNANGSHKPRLLLSIDISNLVFII
jgi:hypothetical protein